MALSEELTIQLTRKLITAKNTVLIKNAFYGYLLSYLPFALDDECPTACTDGKKIIFGTEFLKKLTDGETVFVLLHELMHCALCHTVRQESRDNFLFNIACDIVVNSILLESFGCDLRKISVDGEVSMHLAPDDREGREYSAEQVYQMLLDKAKEAGSGLYAGGTQGEYGTLDDHSLWGQGDPQDAERIKAEWAGRIVAAIETAENYGQYGHLPEFAREISDELESRRIDWREALRNFCRRTLAFDYSWLRADRRYIERDIYLPSFNEEESNEVEARDLLFFVDTSGSMEDNEVSELIAEIRNAISVFNGRLCGKLGFFDALVVEPKDFEDEASFRMIRPAGGGGTSFHCIFRYIDENYADNPPAAVIIMTDGYAPFPEESAAGGVPVLWVILHSDITPPWGDVIKIDCDKE